MDKPALIAAFRALLEDRLTALNAEGQAARSGTRVDGTHRPANRGERAAVTAQGYLAHGLAARAGAVRDDLARLEEVDPGPCDRVGPGALVTLEFDGGAEERWLLLPGGQGDRLSGVLILSPTSPAARALRGLGEGDEATLRRGGAPVAAAVLEVE